jgi:hypothetical protein
MQALTTLRSCKHELQDRVGVRAIAPHLSLIDNQSESYRQFLSGVTRFLNECRAADHQADRNKP